MPDTSDLTATDQGDATGVPDGAARPARSRRRAAARRALPLLVVALLGGVVAILALGLQPVARGSVGPGTLAVRAHFGPARTTLRLPPLGQITASTHDAPLTLEAQVDEVDIDRLQVLLREDEPGDRLRAEVTDDLEPLLRSFGLYSIVTASVAGALTGALVPRRRWPHAVAGMAGGVAAVAGTLGVAWWGFDADAFSRKARFEGPIERAPALLATVRQHVEDFADVRRRVEVLGNQVAELYAVASTEGFATPSSDDVAILHVSDVHSNPLGLEITRQLAERFGVAAVLDTGDLTSFGFPVESRIGDLVGRIPVPYLYVPGNHDSFDNRQTIDQVENVTLLDSEVVDVGGIRILGIADPVFTASNEIDSLEARAIKRSQAPRVRAVVDSYSPDVLAVHDPVLAEAAHGRVPLVVAGHIHKSTAVRHNGTLVLTVGSTGSTGLGSLTVETTGSYEAQVLRFAGGVLVAIDRVELRGVGGAFRVERQIVPADGVPGEATATGH